MPYIGWDNREYEDLEGDNMRRDAAEDRVRERHYSHPVSKESAHLTGCSGSWCVFESITGSRIEWALHTKCLFPSTSCANAIPAQEV